MTDQTDTAPLLLVVDALTAPPQSGIWGTGSWIDPREREALDWVCLARSLGWNVDMVNADVYSLRVALRPGRRWIIFACDPATISEEAMEALSSFLESESTMVIARAADGSSPWSRSSGSRSTGEALSGRNLSWIGDCPANWRCRQSFPARRLEIGPSAKGLATLDDAVLISAGTCGQGALVTLGFHPSESRDASGYATELLRRLLVYSARTPVAWFDLARSVICRMDDPGAAQCVFLRSWSYPQMGANEWTALLEVLERHEAQLSIGYVSGWVDDGDAQRGELQVDGCKVARFAGRTYPSADVVYRDIAGHAPGAVHDYRGQYAVLRRARLEGKVDIQLHGHTHMHPDTASWAQAPNRYDSVDWYRELGALAAPTIARLPLQEHPLALGLQEIRLRFGILPSTLICPGDAWTTAALEAALALGLQAVSSYYYAFRHANRLCWSQHVCAPYLDEPDSRWFDSGLPVVGYFHDREPACEGPQWLDRWLGAWQQAGARRFITLRELTAAHCGTVRMVQQGSSCNLEALCGTRHDLGVAVPVSIHVPRDSGLRSLTYQGQSVAAGPSLQGTYQVMANLQ